MRGALPVLLALSIGAATSSVAAGEPAKRTAGEDPLERLRVQFGKAIALEDDEKWADALAMFQEIGRERMTPQVRFHIALAEEHLDRLISARDGYREAIKMAEADPEKAKEVLENAPKKLAELEPRIPHVTLVIADGGEQTVELDQGRSVRGKGKIELEVDPGKHKVVVKTPAFERSFELEAASRVEFDIPAAPPPRKDDVVKPKPKPEPQPVRVPGNKLPAFVVGGVGVAALAGAGVMLGLRQLAISEVRDGCTSGDSGCDPSLRDVADRGLLFERLSIGFAAGGAALVGTGVALFFTVGADKTVLQEPAKSAVWLAPVPGGLAVGGMF